jgi:hypothetical protein
MGLDTSKPLWMGRTHTVTWYTDTKQWLQHETSTRRQIFLETSWEVHTTLYYVSQSVNPLYAPSGAWGDSKGSPLGSVCCGPGSCFEGQTLAFQLFLYSPSPGLFWSPAVPLPLWGPCRAISGSESSGMRQTCPSHLHRLRHVCLLYYVQCNKGEDTTILQAALNITTI